VRRVRARGEEIRRYLLENIKDNPNSISKLAAERFRITRQAVNGHLKRLVSEGALLEKGATRNKSYALAPMIEWQSSYSLHSSPAPAEDYIWRTDIARVVGTLPDNVQKIWAFGFSEMFNNAIDHSEGRSVVVHVTRTAITTEMVLADDGVGIFKKIQRALSLQDERHAILELSKGKLTTDPTRHTGEGIFFTSRVFDGFDILSGGVYFGHQFGKEEDWLADAVKPHDRGTAVFLRLSNHSSRTVAKIYDQYTDGPDDYGFNKTVVPVYLAQYGNDQLISRSQAKRVMARVELFTRVILDFENVSTIGQAFADEVFRVFAQAHPQLKLAPINTTPEIDHMIARVLGSTALPEGPGNPDGDDG
jgi:anti-sigma regulatory factor (Ser/Thr protein kinase)